MAAAVALVAMLLCIGTLLCAGISSLSRARCRGDVLHGLDVEIQPVLRDLIKYTV